MGSCKLVEGSFREGNILGGRGSLRWEGDILRGRGSFYEHNLSEEGSFGNTIIPQEHKKYSLASYPSILAYANNSKEKAKEE